MKNLALLLILASCASVPKREELSASWQGKSEQTLEKNKFYSTLPLKKDSLSTGEVRFNYLEHRIRATGGQTCFGTGYGFGYYNRFGINTSACSPQEYAEDNCAHQFLIKGGKIVSYDLIGDECQTRCEMLPEEKCK